MKKNSPAQKAAGLPDTASVPEGGEQVQAHEGGEALLWYEKTVEYLFLRDAFFSTPSAGARPLAGLSERAADLAGAQHVLIEFKRAHSDIRSENRKFRAGDRLAARAEMEWPTHRSEPHHLVYGKSDGQGGLKLEACRYFESNVQVDVQAVLRSGVSQAEFVEYLGALLAVKSEDERSSGSVGPEAILQVVEVDGVMQLLGCATLEEFCATDQQLDAALKQVRPCSVKDSERAPSPTMRPGG